jgi:hypothetical protein
LPNFKAKVKIALFPISSSGCVQCALASPIAPKGKSALAKQNLHRSSHIILIGLVFYQSLVRFVTFFNLAGNGLCKWSAGLKVQNFQLRTEPIRLFNISFFPSIVADELAVLQQRTAV